MTMARTSYRNRLERLRGDVAAMGETTLQRYEHAIEVLETGNRQAARQVIDGDDDINEWYLDIENECIDLIALEQPVAGDLRFVAASFKIVTDVERIGDLATNLAANGRETRGPLFDGEELTAIADLAGEMVGDAIAAYNKRDADAARACARRDDELDVRCAEASQAIVREALTASRTEDIESTIESVSRALLTIRDVERVGDHAVNICARTVYMLEHDEALIY